MPLNLRHQTAAEFGVRYWLAVRSAQQDRDKAQMHRLVRWLLTSITAGDITDAGARAAFNVAFGRSLTAAQWASFKASKLQPMADRYAALLAEPEL